MFTAPNVLTLLRIFAVPVFLWASFRGDFRLAFVLFIAAALTDLFDGFIARRFNQRSRLGAFLDPAADKVMMICGFLFYTLRRGIPVAIPPWLTFTVLIRDFVIILFAYLLYTRVHVKRFPPSWAGKATTALQAATLTAVIAVNAFAPPQARSYLEILFRIVMLVTLFSGWDYLRRAERMLAQAEA